MQKYNNSYTNCSVSCRVVQCLAEMWIIGCAINPVSFYARHVRYRKYGVKKEQDGPEVGSEEPRHACYLFKRKPKLT